jgi:hypothetical protein
MKTAVMLQNVVSQSNELKVSDDNEKLVTDLSSQRDGYLNDFNDSPDELITIL